MATPNLLAASPSPRKRRGAKGFTLIELVLALALLVIILSTAYSIIVDSLQADQNLDRLTVPEKVGEGLLSLMRRDLGGTFFRNMGTRVFHVEDGGEAPDARDELRFVSTVEPTPLDSGATDDPLRLRTMTGIVYFVRPSELPDGLEGYTLFRKEIVEFDPIDPLLSPGVNYELYSNVRYFSVECFNGWAWIPDWDSEQSIIAEQDEAFNEEAGDSIARVSDPTATPNALANAPGVGTDQLGVSGALLPPAAVPVAVRVELGIYVMSRGKALLDADGNPLIKKFSTVVPILTAQRLALQLDDGMDELEGEGAAAGGAASIETGGAALSGGPGGRGTGGRGAGGRGAGGRGGRGAGGRFGGRAGAGDAQPTRASRLRAGGAGFGGGR